MQDSTSNESDLVVAGIEEADENEPTEAPKISADNEFFAKHAFRVVYRTNFLLPQLKDLVSKGDILNIWPKYQRQLR